VFAASNPTRLDAERIGYPKTLLNGVASEIDTERADFHMLKKIAKYCITFVTTPQRRSIRAVDRLLAELD
jgi:hypothetical protein